MKTHLLNPSILLPPSHIIAPTAAGAYISQEAQAPSKGILPACREPEAVADLHSS